jgi:hypothetical protein
MSRHMRTTVRLDDALLTQAKAEAARRGITLTSLIELGLRLAVVQGPAAGPRRKVNLPVSDVGGGVLPGVDISNSADLWDILDGYK